MEGFHRASHIFLLVANKIHYRVRSYLLSNIVHVHKGTYAIVPENIYVCTSMYVCRQRTTWLTVSLKFITGNYVCMRCFDNISVAV